MTKEERKIALHCLKAYSDYHSEVCEECVNYPNCDHTIHDDVTETIIKALEQEPCEDCVSRAEAFEALNSINGTSELDKAFEAIEKLPPVIPKGVTITDFADKCRECGREKVLDKIRDEIDRQEKWLLLAGYNAYNVDIAFDAIKAVMAERR